MYEVDNRDDVQELADVPQSSIGAPIPVIISDENRVVLAYVLPSRVAGNPTEGCFAACSIAGLTIVSG